MSKRYIHYGSPAFMLQAFHPIKNKEGFNKPGGGLWASAVDAQHSWKQWVECTKFYPERLTMSFEFELSPNARILELRPDNVWDLPVIPNTPMWRRRPEIRDHYSMVTNIDFEALARDYDVLECSLSDYPSLYWSLYGWDCDCILVMNPDVIVEVKND